LARAGVPPCPGKAARDLFLSPHRSAAAAAGGERDAHVQRFGGLLIIGLGLLGGCTSHADAPSRLTAAETAAVELCVDYAQLPAAKPAETPMSIEQTCTRYVEQGAQNSLKGGAAPHPSKLTADYFRQMCRNAVPDDTGYCDGFARARDREVERLSLTEHRDGGGFFQLFELGKACILLADRVLGRVPDSGYCIDGRGLFASVQEGDANHLTGPINAVTRRFAVGTETSTMIEALGQADFTCSPNGAEGHCDGDTGVIAFKHRKVAGVAGFAWTLTWRADAAGRLADLEIQLKGAGL
jgi:hypothetical protein